MAPSVQILVPYVVSDEKVSHKVKFSFASSSDAAFWYILAFSIILFISYPNEEGGRCGESHVTYIERAESGGVGGLNGKKLSFH